VKEYEKENKKGRNSKEIERKRKDIGKIEVTYMLPSTNIQNGK
jgi:hypothetical protein